MKYWIGLGANIGDPIVQLAEAIVRLTHIKALRLERISSVYKTAPVGNVQQPDFLNMVLCVEVGLSPEGLIDECLKIEKRMGRVREEKWGPRIIDIDLLLYEGPPVDLESVKLPHPHLMQRQFVLVPLAEIAPDLKLPDGRLARQAAKPDAAGVELIGTIGECMRRRRSLSW